MKSANNILIMAMAVMFFGTTQAQKERKDGTPWIMLETIKKEASWSTSFKEKASYAYSYLDSTFVTGSPKNKIQAKNFLNFENAIGEGEGGEILPKKLVSTASQKHPGNKGKAVKSRVRMYVKHMERVLEDDE